MILSLSFSVSAHAETSYTYNYDYWGEFTDSPDSYTTSLVATSADFVNEDGSKGLEKNLKSPEGLYINGERIFICDTGNNRILECKLENGYTSLKLVKIYESFEDDKYVAAHPNSPKYKGVKTFNAPTDICISEDGNYFICDKENQRIVKLDKDFQLMEIFIKPDDASLDENLEFKPQKLVVDTAERVYCVANINKGLAKYEEDSSFSGFVGATPVTYNFWDWLWKKFASQAQRDQMINFVPTEYDNLYMDKEGFIYVCTGKPKDEDIKSESAQVVRKLNLLGNDILVRNGNNPIYGDLYMGSGGGMSGASRFIDITTLDNDIYVCLDKTRGRLFGYDDQGRLVYAFGGTGNMDGYFRNCIAIDHLGNNLLVLDNLDCSVTVFIPTEFGELIYTAIDQFDKGEYDAAEQSWRKVMENDGNCDLAYIGVGRSLLRQKKYGEAMDYFKLKHDAENYSKAFKQYRKEWVENNIVLIVIVLLLIILIPLGIGKLKSIKHEIDTADIFQL